MSIYACGLLSIVQLALAALKLAGLITLGWGWVLMPLWAPPVLVLMLGMVAAVSGIQKDRKVK